MASNTHSVKYWRLAILGIVFLLTGFFASRIFISAFSHDTESSSTQFPLLAHRLFEPEHDDMIINFTELREALKKKQADSKLPLGIYFEYLPSGSSIGVNDQLEVGIGSLSKVPAVIAVYKQIENNTMNLDQVLTIDEKNLDSFFGDLWKKVLVLNYLFEKQLIIR